MKKIQSMMLMLLVAVRGRCVQSCGSDDDNTPSGYNSVADVREDFSKTLKFMDRYWSEYSNETIAAKLTAEERLLFLSFVAAVSQADASLQDLVNAGTTPADSKVLSTYKKYLEDYTSGKGFEGYIKITKVKNGDTSDVGTVTFTK